MDKAYLGDGVYAEVCSGMIRLTTEGGHLPMNIIMLEPETVEALIRYVERAKTFYAKQRQAAQKE